MCRRMLDRHWRARVEQALQPLGERLRRFGVTPDALTGFGLVASATTAVLIASGHLVLGVIGIAVSGLGDLLDGAVARRTRRGQRSSKNRSKAVARVGRLHVKVAAQRAAALHTFTYRLARAHPVIVLETLTTKNLMANRRLAGAIGDQGWGELSRQLTYKTEWRGGVLLSAPRFFPSAASRPATRRTA